MPSAKDRAGECYGDLEVICRNGNTERGDSLWTCKCRRCGGTIDIPGSHLKEKKIAAVVIAKNMLTFLDKLSERFLSFKERGLTVAEMHYIYAIVIYVEPIKNFQRQQFVKTQKDVDVSNTKQI